MTIDDLPEVLTIDETARFLRISRGLAFTAARRGEIPAVRVGRRLLVPRVRLVAWLHDKGR
ncbi:MAG TPA: helix-turn-helix domain-containing protein [Frankiaceae bacterium]|jgi:excisionase family DNA binding protein|nr:helix-turn-helix domain-containing protein [Frankiaceae bacterium]